MCKKGFCIICRQNDVELSDEHVVPDSMGGYYHVYNVCKNCNSMLGSEVDKHLVNHAMTQFQRMHLKIDGKKGKIPNPLIGDGVDEEGDKIKVVSVDGVLTPQIVTKISVAEDKRSFSITIDKSNEDQEKAIEEKLLKRLSLNKDRFRIERHRTVTTIQPTIKKSMQVDLRNFKIGLLKIAYEYTLDKIPEYINDPLAILYSEILQTHNLNRLEEITFMGDGFNPAVMGYLENVIDMNEKRHVLVLQQNGNELICQIVLFKTFYMVVKMSDTKCYLSEDEIYILINDIEKKRVDFYKWSEYRGLRMKQCGYLFDEQGQRTMEKLTEKNLQVGFHANDYGQNILFNMNGEAVLTHEQLLDALQEKDANVEFGNDGIKITYNIEGDYYVKVAPTNALLKVVAFVVNFKMKRI